MRRDVFERLWCDPNHWRAGMVYYCPEDPRVIVPRRLRWMGWTMNFAHPHVFLWLVLTIVIPTGPFLLLVACSVRSLLAYVVVLGVSIFALMLLSHRLSNPAP